MRANVGSYLIERADLALHTVQERDVKATAFQRSRRLRSVFKKGALQALHPRNEIDEVVLTIHDKGIVVERELVRLRQATS